MLNRPYIRTEKSVLTRQDALLNDNKRPQEVYNILLEESGAPYRSASMSKEPRNLKQIRKRQPNLKQKSKTNYPEVDQLQALMLSQRDPDSLVKTVTVTGQSYITFAYTDKQINDIAKCCCKNSDTAVLGVDTTFNLCDLWSTDTSYRNKRLLNTTSGGHPVHLGPIMLHFTKDDGTFGRFALELLSANPCLKDLKTSS